MTFKPSDNPSPMAGRLRAQKLYPGPLVCEIEGCGKKAERHHKDGNTGNNTRENIAFLCCQHHFDTDGRMRTPKARANMSRAIKALRASKPKPTHCQRGHLYDEANIRITKKGSRICRICTRQLNRESYHRLRHAATPEVQA